MFIRIKTSPNSTKRAVQNVKSICYDKSVSQKIVRHVGTALDDVEFDKLKNLAKFIKAKLENEANPTVFSPESIAEMVIQASNDNHSKKYLISHLTNF